MLIVKIDRARVEIICMGQIVPVSCEPFPVPSPSDVTLQVIAGNHVEPLHGSEEGTSLSQFLTKSTSISDRE